MVPSQFNWELQTEERSLRRDKRRHAGYVDLNQSALNRDMWPQNSFSALLLGCKATNAYGNMSALAEIPPSPMLGRLLAGVVETEMFPACLSVYSATVDSCFRY
jgi:hypothetical protein